ASTMPPLSAVTRFWLHMCRAGKSPRRLIQSTCVNKGWRLRTLADMTDDRSSLALEALAERALEVLVTHNEAVSCDDLACALGVSSAHAWEIANTLRSRGYAIVDESDRTAAVSDVMTAGKQAPRFRTATQPMSSLGQYGSVPIRFTVTSVFDVRPID